MNLPLSNKKSKQAACKILHTDSDCLNTIIQTLNALLSHVHLDRNIVIVCVGTDRSTGDCLGPMIGTKLKGLLNGHTSIYGTLDEPVHAMNLRETIEHIKQSYTQPFIIAIDACLGQVSSIGCVQIAEGAVKPGAGVNKELPPVGDIHITGIVNVGGFMEYFVLQNTRLSLVMRMADVIADGLSASMKQRYAAVNPSLSMLDEAPLFPQGTRHIQTGR
ncbi:spore protease YyaC [Marinicrinis lubricantis]|uniref:Spore protease YyaC n=1 Tax=Marinicrinis lubricantis TaxID=2086470 RepID=A0ABW1IH29_9BACL